jgi:3-hydroxyisobutyrate dehydrogenase-like beta-hydroxyacid dehydrogenase
MRVAVLGQGRMGAAIAGRLVEDGHTVVVWDRPAARTAPRVARGAEAAASVGEAVARVDVAITSLSNDDAVREVALGPHGVVDSAGAGGALYADASTISPDLSRELSLAYPDFVSMPVSGSPEVVASGEAVFLAGGPEASLQRLEPVLRSLSPNHRTYPEARLAAVAKLAVNTVLLAGLVSLAEGLAVGRAGGLSDDQLRTLLAESPMVGPGLRRRFEPLLTGSGPTLWTVALGAKDLGLALELAEADQSVPVVAAVKERYEQATAEGLGGEDVAAVGRIYPH